MFPDSEIAKVITESKFGIIIDETTDYTSGDTCAVVVRYVDEIMKKAMLDLVNSFVRGIRRFQGRRYIIGILPV